MKKLIILLFICSIAYAEDYDRKTIWTTGDLITATRLNADPDETARILGDDTDGLISDGNVASGAHIAETKIKFLVSTGHDHDGTDSVTFSHVNSRTLLIGADLAHTSGTFFNIGVGNANEISKAHPVIRFNVDTAVWELSNDGITFSSIATN